eukprot:SAG31_NODE_3756_length_3912_cov_99.932074_2_plen_157_part_00
MTGRNSYVNCLFVLTGRGKLTIAELLERCKPHVQEKKFRANEIAASYGHRVFWTPPYMHPLAFCEPIWNAVKAPIADKTPGSMKQLKTRLRRSIETLKGHTIVRCYAKTRQAQDELWMRFENDEFEVVDGDPVREETDSDEDEDEGDAALEFMDLE